TFRESRSRAIEGPGNQALQARCRKCTEQPRYLVARQDHRNANPRLRTAEFPHPRKLRAENFPIEKQQRAQSLLVCRYRHVALVREMRQEAFDVVLAEFTRMPHPAVADEGARPVQVCLFGAKTVVEITNTFPQP